jgi:hypothetical protein
MESQAGLLLADQAASLRLVSQEELKLREADLEDFDPELVHRGSVGILEFQLVCASLNEAAAELGVRTLAQAFAKLDRIVSLAGSIARLDVAVVLQENAHLLPKPAPFSNHADRPAGADLGLVVRYVRSLVGFCPIEHLEQLGKDFDQPDLAHRCRVAFDALVAFTRRNDASHDEAARTVGRAYAEGRLSLDEVSTLLGHSRTDAVAFLEEHGFCRDAGALGLADDERNAILAAAREERLRRAGGEIHGLAEREVAASQRIEGVDARPWLPRT